MTKKLFTAMAVMLFSVTAFAQQLTEGFYRVQNYGSQRYLYVRDCSGNVSTLGADMDACELWPNLEDAISDPSSIMYLEKHGSQWDITSQATGVHEMTNMYMTINYDGKFCQVYAEGQYLYENGISDFDPNMGLLAAKTQKDMPGKTNYRLWNTPKVDSNTDNYFGFKPTVTAGGKYYAPFFADFAYTPKNNNVKTWYVSQVDKKNGIAVIKEITGTVAKQQAVFVECNSPTPSSNKVDLTTAAGTSASTNVMTGVFFCNGLRSNKPHPSNPAYVEFNPTTMRLLAVGSDGKLTFQNTSSTLVEQEVCINNKWGYMVKCIPHNTSYLTVDADCPASLKVMTESEYEEYLKSLEPERATGDVNGDGRINVADIQTISNAIATGDKNPVADVNGDGHINVADIQTVCNIIAANK